MSDKVLKHATLVQLESKGVLLCGKSGVGKSDLAFRLIESHGAVLIADDVVMIYSENGTLYGEVSENLRGLIEVRGVGIARYPYLEKSPINLLVDLVDNPTEVERLPEMQKIRLLDYELLYLKLYAKEASAPQKILLKLRDNLLKKV